MQGEEETGNNDSNINNNLSIICVFFLYAESK